MDKEKEFKLSELACKLSSMTFVLHGCCLYYGEQKIKPAKFVDFAKVLHDLSNELFELL